MNSNEKWFYAVNDEQKGPVSIEELYTQFKNGVINNESLVWQEGMADWLELCKVETLQTAFANLKDQQNQTQEKSDEWFYAVNDQRHGPVKADEIRELIKNGSLNSDSLVWQQGQPEWIALRYCREFAEVLSTVPPKIPPRNTPQVSSKPASSTDDKMMLYVAYGCFLATIFFVLTIIAAELIAYITDDETKPALHRAHYAFIRKHGWFAVGLGLLGFITAPIFIGFIILLGVAIYIIFIGILGLVRLNEDRLPQ